MFYDTRGYIIQCRSYYNNCQKDMHYSLLVYPSIHYNIFTSQQHGRGWSNSLYFCQLFLQNVLPQVYSEEATEEKGEIARLVHFYQFIVKQHIFVGATAIADLVKTTLGPKGMVRIFLYNHLLQDKILHSVSEHESKITITNDGATILKSIQVNNPAAKILIEISKAQDDAVGDGTTTVAVLAGELLRQAEKLVEKKLHPQIIIEGFKAARDVARKRLHEIAVDNSEDPEKFKADLLNIAMTTLSSKLLVYEKEHFAKLAVEAVTRLKGSTNLGYIQIIKKPGGTLKDSFLDEGFILEKSISVGCPRKKKNPKILIANTPMDYDKIKIYGSKVRADSMEKVAEIEAAEKAKMKAKVDKILNHMPDVFINRQLIYNYPEQLMADKGVMVIEHADFEGTERLAAVLGGDIVSTFDNPELTKLGTCNLVEEIMIGEDKFIKFSGCTSNEACTIVLRGSGTHILDEAERSLHDALCVLVQTIEDRKTIYGGGNSEIEMMLAVEELGKSVKTKEGLAIEAFAQALKTIPAIIADNGGYDSAALVQALISEIFAGNKTSGLDMRKGAVGDMKELGVTVLYFLQKTLKRQECLKVKEQALLSACEAAEMILRVDHILTCAPRRREDPRERFGHQP
eukprot:TRINITY_DN1195_c0_g1_i1.p1 TRINITY_DN1195_c0_g1~~TRINITY_DN1195_c0_g1_i1.p1  ORF type:complete len:628 (-),score=55.99 TRINITY_DN1195_c0_g1_i1:2521-4404(-)